MTIKEIPYTVYPPCEERTEWTIRFHNVNNIGGGGNTFKEALVDAYKNLEFEIDYLKGDGIDILKDTEKLVITMDDDFYSHKQDFIKSALKQATPQTLPQAMIGAITKTFNMKEIIKE